MLERYAQLLSTMKETFIWFCVGVAAVFSSCVARGQEVSCDRPVHVVDGVSSLEIDLDCDGDIEHVMVEQLRDSLGVWWPVIVVSGFDQEIQVVLNSEPAPEIVGFADLDGNGISDVLLVSIDPGVLYPFVVLLSDTSGTVAQFESTEAARAANVIFRESDWKDCHAKGWPSFEEVSSEVVLSIAYGNPPDVSCESDIMRRRFKAISGVLRPVDP